MKSNLYAEVRNLYAEVRMGNKVRVKSNLIIGKRYGALIMLKPMKKFCGNTYTVKYVANCAVLLEDGEDQYGFSAEMIEIINPVPVKSTRIERFDTACLDACMWIDGSDTDTVADYVAAVLAAYKSLNEDEKARAEIANDLSGVLLRASEWLYTPDEDEVE